MPESMSLSRTRAWWAVFCLSFFVSGCDPAYFLALFDSPETGVSVLTLLGTDGRELEVGDEVQGALSSSDYVGLNESYLEAWLLEVQEGQTLSIDLVSEDFDSYLYVVGPGLKETLKDDDGGGACHSRIDFTVLESGVFHVVASSSSSNLRFGEHRRTYVDPDDAALGADRICRGDHHRARPGAEVEDRLS